MEQKPDSGKHVRITMQIQDYKDYEAGLLLLVLKDLWIGDLAVRGEKNVGRGVFEGIGATIEFSGKCILLKRDPSTESPQEETPKATLQQFVTELRNYAEVIE